MSVFIQVLVLLRSFKICGPQNCDFPSFQLWNLHIIKNMPSQNLPSVILHFFIHLAFFLESDREKGIERGFPYEGPWINITLFLAEFLNFWIFFNCHFLWSKLQNGKLGDSSPAVLPDWWILLYSVCEPVTTGEEK